MSERHVAEPAVAVRAALGECPVWDAERGVLHWIDAVRGEVLTLAPGAGEPDVVRLGARVGSIALRAGGGLVAAVDDELLLLDAAGVPEARFDGPWRGQEVVVNDGACDAAGRFWVGSAATGPRAHGALYRVDPDGVAHTASVGIGESNGIDWSPPDDVLYHVDSTSQGVDAMPFSAVDGAIGARSRLIAIPEAEGIPDGLTVDAEGAIWLAVWGAGEVRRYDPAGELLATVTVPAAHVTSCAFGGPDLADLWITTAYGELDAAAYAREPRSGWLFRARPGVRGLPARRFGG